MQGEPEFERLKRVMEELKNQPRPVEATYRTANEMERHRHQLTDAAIGEQIDVQSAFREQGVRLQQIYDNRRATEMKLHKWCVPLQSRWPLFACRLCSVL